MPDPTRARNEQFMTGSESWSLVPRPEHHGQQQQKKRQWKKPMVARRQSAALCLPALSNSNVGHRHAYAYSTELEPVQWVPPAPFRMLPTTCTASRWPLVPCYPAAVAVTGHSTIGLAPSAPSTPSGTRRGQPAGLAKTPCLQCTTSAARQRSPSYRHTMAW